MTVRYSPFEKRTGFGLNNVQQNTTKSPDECFFYARHESPTEMPHHHHHRHRKLPKKDN